ncbi:hypothetical protein MNEG_14270, partial [Monoraphidium neglectum]
MFARERRAAVAPGRPAASPRITPLADARALRCARTSLQPKQDFAVLTIKAGSDGSNGSNDLERRPSAHSGGDGCGGAPAVTPRRARTHGDHDDHT